MSSVQVMPPIGSSTADFDTRWAAWVERGRVHERRARHRFVVWASVFALGAALIYTFLPS